MQIHRVLLLVICKQSKIKRQDDRMMILLLGTLIGSCIILSIEFALLASILFFLWEQQKRVLITQNLVQILRVSIFHSVALRTLPCLCRGVNKRILFSLSYPFGMLYYFLHMDGNLIPNYSQNNTHELCCPTNCACRDDFELSFCS